MNAEQIEQRSLHINPEKLLAFVSELMEAHVGCEDDPNPVPDRYASLLSEALDRVPIPNPPAAWTNFDRPPSPLRTRHLVVGPHLETWKVFLTSILAKHPELYDVIGGGHSFGEEVALNPQPLPPRLAFLAAVVRTVISRTELLQEMADAIAHEGERRGIIIVGGYLSRFCDDFCGNGFTMIWPFPGPRPWWFPAELNAVDLVVMASQFHQAAKRTHSPELRQQLANAGAKFVEAGLSKIR
jgi:hypothetical protein